MTTVIESLEAVPDFVGAELGVSDWVEVTQERIDAFAAVTGDHQWIHCDPERARRESPWKQTIAHGYLTLSLAPALLSQLVTVLGTTRVINAGIDRMRLSAPVPAGSRVRMAAELAGARSLGGSGTRVVFQLRFEVEGSARPACTATAIYVYAR